MADAPGVGLAFAAGTLSFLSPCCLPLVPGYLATVSGMDLKREDRRVDPRVLGRSALFVATFSLLFVLLGLGATAAGSFLFSFIDVTIALFPPVDHLRPEFLRRAVVFAFA